MERTKTRGLTTALVVLSIILVIVVAATVYLYLQYRLGQKDPSGLLLVYITRIGGVIR